MYLDNAGKNPIQEALEPRLTAAIMDWKRVVFYAMINARERALMVTALSAGNDVEKSS